MLTTQLNWTQLIPTGTGEFCKFWTFCCWSSWVELSCRHDQNARSDKTEANLVAASCDPVGYFAACAIGHSIVYAEVSSIIMNYNNNIIIKIITKFKTFMIWLDIDIEQKHRNTKTNKRRNILGLVTWRLWYVDGDDYDTSPSDE